jgi:hypothetical protein
MHYLHYFDSLNVVFKLLCVATAIQLTTICIGCTIQPKAKSIFIKNNMIVSIGYKLCVLIASQKLNK